MYQDRHRLTREQSHQLGRQLCADVVYCGMRMESRAVTFPQTKTILEGVNVPGVRLDDIQAILNMRDAWRFLLDTLEAPVTVDCLCKLNGYIARNEALTWGALRTGAVSISGTDYVPPVPSQEAVEGGLGAILSGDAPATGKALMAFCWGARGQFFWDGNKRTSLVLANKIMLEAGVGMLTITEGHMEAFNRLLVEFYNTGEAGELMDFLYAHAIRGIDLGPSG